jgi:filamin
MCFVVELKDAGEGTLEISLSGPSGQNIPNNVVSLGPALFEVCYSPVESGQHRANINFNKENVAGKNNRHLET